MNRRWDDRPFAWWRVRRAAGILLVSAIYGTFLVWLVWIGQQLVSDLARLF